MTSVSDFKNIHKGEPCFIYGSGCSLKDISTKNIDKYISISVNAGILKAPFSKYFVSDDSSISKWDFFYSVLQNKDITKFFFRDRFENEYRGEDIVFYDHTWWYSPKEKKFNLEGIRLRKEEPIIGAANSAGSAIHLAYIMGCSCVVLMGFDCCFIDGKKYFWQFWDMEKQPKQIYGKKLYFSANNKSGKRANENFNFFMKYWQDFSTENKDIMGNEFPIIDCSNGLLTCFQKKDLNDLIKWLKK